MTVHPPFRFKVATEEWEFERIHELNYRTFVEEIPQHQPSATRRLVDKFHAENTYLICVCGDELVGMLAARGNRPFSLDSKLPNLDAHLPAGRAMCELRLLAVERKFRAGQVFPGLMALLWKHALEKGYDMAIISGTTRQLKLYRHLGFKPFGPLVGSGDAWFQPMVLAKEDFEPVADRLFNGNGNGHEPRSKVNFLPGPVAIHPDVQRAFEATPESHRGDDFIATFQAVKLQLCALTGASRVQVLLGSGTLGNDTVAAQLSLEGTPGLVLANGEFGARLVDHARRWRLEFKALEFPWGQPLDLREVAAALDGEPHPRWLWCVHGETSTGIRNDLEALERLCSARGVKLAADCISTLGTSPVNLRGVWLATSASGKGLAAYPGLSLVFHHHELSPALDRLPRYLDLGMYAATAGVPFTQSSNLVHALHAAVRRVDWPRRLSELASRSAVLRARLRKLGFNILAAEEHAAPAVITLVLPEGTDSGEVSRKLEKAGYLLSAHSEYLRRRNWLQICLMGECRQEDVDLLLTRLQRMGLTS
jgi:aspartate aminotransferase-like enzyme